MHGLALKLNKEGRKRRENKLERKKWKRDNEHKVMQNKEKTKV